MAFANACGEVNHYNDKQPSLHGLRARAKTVRSAAASRFQSFGALGLVAAVGMLAAGCKQLATKTVLKDPMAGETPGEQRAFSLGHGVEHEFRWVPPGKFMPDRPPGHKSGRDPVVIADGFWISAGLITEADWQKVKGAKRTGQLLTVGVKIAPDTAARVSWHDCQEFLGRLKSPDPGWIYELSGEAEWEHACRAGAATPAATLPTYGAPPVGDKSGNAWSIRDMHGDVQEWCRNSVSPHLPNFATRRGPAARDPRFRTTGRDSELRFLQFNRVGFRIVLVRIKPAEKTPGS